VTRINPEELAPAKGFSHAVVAPAGRTVYLAGQTALDGSGRIVAIDDLVGQFTQALGNLLAALRAAGGVPENLVSVRIYAVDLAAYRAVARDLGEVWRRLCGREYPAMAAIGVARLWDAEALVEIEGVAVVPEPDQPSTL